MQNRQDLEAQKLVMLSQQLWPHHETPPSITSFQTQTLLLLIAEEAKQAAMDTQSNVAALEEVRLKKSNEIHNLEAQKGKISAEISTVKSEIQTMRNEKEELEGKMRNSKLSVEKDLNRAKEELQTLNKKLQDRERDLIKHRENLEDERKSFREQFEDEKKERKKTLEELDAKVQRKQDMQRKKCYRSYT